jgi:hypothetical protein
MDASSRVPGPLTWTLRGFGWLIGIAILGAFVFKYGSFNAASAMQECLAKSRSERHALLFAQELVSCAQAKSGTLGRRSLSQAKEMMNALPNTPCRYLGTWRASRTGAVYSITLDADSTFVAEPLEPRNADTLTGAWGVYKDKMVWFYENGRIWPPDINPIKQQSDDVFTLVEADRSLTTFILVKRSDWKACAPTSSAARS